jgi:hypothetical protein
MKVRASIPPHTASEFAPGTPIDEVCEARRQARARVSEALARVAALAQSLSTAATPAPAWTDERSHA